MHDTQKPKRFSRANVLAELDAMAERIGTHWGFDPSNGTAQLGGGIDEAVAYGRWLELRRLADEIHAGYFGYGAQ